MFDPVIRFSTMPSDCVSVYPLVLK